MRTVRLCLDKPTPTDVDKLHALYSDPRVWTHLPSGRHHERAQTAAMVDRWRQGWNEIGLGQWVVREGSNTTIIGHGGCAVRQACFWNLGYRFRPEVQGRGLATELSHVAVSNAHAVRPELPVVAYLLEHNAASARVAEKVGLVLRHRAPDVGNDDPDAIRLIYADRELAEDELAATLGHG